MNHHRSVAPTVVLYFLTTRTYKTVVYIMVFMELAVYTFDVLTCHATKCSIVLIYTCMSHLAYY